MQIDCEVTQVLNLNNKGRKEASHNSDQVKRPSGSKKNRKKVLKSKTSLRNISAAS